MPLKYKKIIRYGALGIAGAAIVVLAVLGFSYFRKLHSPGLPVISAIPPTAGVVFEIRDARGLYEKVKSAVYWEDMCAFPFFSEIRDQLQFTDSLLTLSEDARALVEGKPLFISLHPSVQNICNALFLTEASVRNPLKEIEHIFQGWYQGKIALDRISFKTFEFLSVKMPGASESLFFGAHKGVLVCSRSRTLVEDALLQAESGTSISDKAEFSEVAETVGKRVDANIYMNYEQFHKIITALVSDAYKDKLAFVPVFGIWSALDVNFKEDALVLNGFSNAAADKGLLYYMQNQKPAKVELVKLMPHNTASFIFLGFDNFKLYFNNRHKIQGNATESQDTDSDLKAFNATYGIDVETELADQISSEAAYMLIPGTVPGKMESFLVVRFKDKEILKDLSVRLTATTKSRTGSLPDTSAYRDYSFGSFDYPEIFNLLLGTSFNIDELHMHTIIDNYLVMGASRDALVQIVNAVVFNRNLNNSPSFNKLSELTSANANIYLFCNNQQSVSSVIDFTTKDLADALGIFSDKFARFETFAIQLSASNNLFYNNICVQYNGRQVADTSFSLWETEIENPATGTIYKVINHNDNSREVICSDDRNNLYLIDRNGAILWQIPTGEQILSSIYQIDFLNNGKLQFLFNTANYIYLVDRNGQNVSGFPLKLKHKATNGLSVFDYDNNKTYRIFLATEKNEIINLDKNGEKVNGWNIYKTQDVVEQAIQFIRLLGKDFIIATDKNGKAYLLDRRGEIRIKPDKSFEKSEKNRFYHLITSDNKGKLVSSLRNGKVVMIDFNGKTEEIQLAGFSPDHYFIFEDIDNNSIKDYIFVDEKRIAIFDFNKNLLKEHIIDGVAAMHPVYFEGQVKYKLGLVTNNNKLYLINNELNITEGFPIDGTCNFALDYTDAMKGYIVAANKRVIYKYLLE